MLDTGRRQKILTANNLCIFRKEGSNGYNSTPLLTGACLFVSRGEVVAIRGPSGCGKTTLLKSLARLHPIADGSLHLNNTPSADFSPFQWRRLVAYSSQKPTLIPRTVRDNLVLGIRLMPGQPRIPDDLDLRKKMDEIGLGEIDLGRPAGELSGGEAARVSLLRTLLTSPLCLLLDEPTASLDDESTHLLSRVIHGFIREGGCGIIVQHDSRLSICRRSYEILDRRLVQRDG